MASAITDIINTAKSAVSAANQVANVAKGAVNDVGSLLKLTKKQPKSNGPAIVAQIAKRNNKIRKTKTKKLSIYRTTNPLPKLKQNNTIFGSDLLYALTVPTGGLHAGDVMYSIAINPNTVPISRLSKMAKLYTKFKFTKFRVIYKGAAGTIQGGEILGYFNTNVKNNVETDSIANLMKASAFNTQDSSRLYEDKTWTLTNDSSVPLYTDIKQSTAPSDTSLTDPKWNCQGKFYLLAATDIPDTATLGILYTEWEVQFSMPQVDYDVLDPGAAFYANADNTSVTSSAPMGVPDDMEVLELSTFTPEVSSTYPNMFIMAPGTFEISYEIDCANAITAHVDLADAFEIDEWFATTSSWTKKVQMLCTSTTKWYFSVALSGAPGAVTAACMGVVCVPDPPPETTWMVPRGKCVKRPLCLSRYRRVKKIDMYAKKVNRAADLYNLYKDIKTDYNMIEYDREEKKDPHIADLQSTLRQNRGATYTTSLDRSYNMLSAILKSIPPARVYPVQSSSSVASTSSNSSCSAKLTSKV